MFRPLIFKYSHQKRSKYTIFYVHTGVPITTDQVRYGLRVGVIVLPAHALLKTPQALKVVGPRAFNFDIDYREPRGLDTE